MPTPQEAPATLTLVRAHDTQPRCTLRFSTGGAPVPWALIAGTWPAARLWGKAATFDGSVTAIRESESWKLDVSGHVDQIELDSLLAAFPHRLTGTADLQLEHATIHRGRLESAAGTLTAGPGVISRSLVRAAHDHLQLEVSRQAFLGRSGRLDYRQLKLTFDVDESGLALRGDLPQAAGALLVDDAGVLARQPAIERQPVVDLLRTLVPQTTVQVPATRETNPLAVFLPVPPIVPPPGSEAPLPQARAIRVTPQ